MAVAGIVGVAAWCGTVAVTPRPVAASSCISGPIGIAVSGPDGSGTTQPVLEPVTLTVMNSFAPIGSTCPVDTLHIDWSGDTSGSGSPITVGANAPATATYNVDVYQTGFTTTTYPCGYQTYCTETDPYTTDDGSASVTIDYVDPGPVNASVSLDTPPATAGQTLTFTAHYTSVAPAQVQWDFGDGSGLSRVGAHVYSAPGDYTVTALIVDEFGAGASPTLALHVSAPLTPSFTVSESTVDLGTVVRFDASASSDDPSSTITAYDWNFGDGATGQGETISHLFTTTGTYTVTLTLQDSRGGSASETASVAVQDSSAGTSDAPPSAAFQVTTAPPAAGQAVSFDATTSSDSDGTVSSYTWSFGDGSSGVGVVPSHVYAAPGNYPVSLTVVDNAGLSSTVTDTVTVADAPPSAGFAADPFSPVAGSAASFDGGSSSDADGTLTGYAWDFGDGGTAQGATAQHTYSAPGTYAVTLTVTDDAALTGTLTRQVVVRDAPPSAAFSVSTPSPHAGSAVSFDGSASSDLDGSVTGYAWDFGDGTGATAAMPSHVYAKPGTYTVVLTATDNAGLSGTVAHSVSIADAPPLAAFRVATTTPIAESPVSFDASASGDVDGTVAGYVWSFGDGTSGTGETPSHTYGLPGSYPVTLTVTDDAGLTGTVAQSVSVSDAAPAASFTVTTPSPVAALPTGFDASTSSDPDGTVTADAWSFGDGGTANGVTPQHTYASAGTYDVTLTVTDDGGLTATTTRSVVVHDAPPAASFAASPAAPTVGGPVSFDGRASSDPDGSVAGYAWSFGDGGSATGATPSHTYSAPGSYTVTLTVTDDAGLTSSTSQLLTVAYGNADLSVSVAGAVKKSGQYTYTVTVTDFGPSAAQGITLTNALDPSETLAATPVVPSGITCSGVALRATGTITCTSSAAYRLASGGSFTVTFTVNLPSPSRVKTVSEHAQVSAANPDPVTGNDTATLTTSLPAK